MVSIIAKCGIIRTVARCFEPSFSSSDKTKPLTEMRERRFSFERCGLASTNRAISTIRLQDSNAIFRRSARGMSGKACDMLECATLILPNGHE